MYFRLHYTHDAIIILTTMSAVGDMMLRHDSSETKKVVVISVYLFQLMIMCVCVKRLYEDGHTDMSAKCNHDIYILQTLRSQDEGALHSDFDFNIPHIQHHT